MNEKHIIKCQAIIRGFLYRKNQPLSVIKLMKLKSHSIVTKKRKSQLDFYIENNASKEILHYVDVPGKTFGEKHMENIAREYFKLDLKKDTAHDHIKLNKKIEQKSARYNANGSDWIWQHIEMNHNFDYLLLCGLDFHNIKFFISSRKIIEQLIESKIITGQGRIKNGTALPQQGYWFSRNNLKKKGLLFEDYFTEIKNEKDLILYLNTF